MKKVYSPTIKRSYWIGTEKSPDLLPVFTPEEAEMLRKTKDLMTPEMLLQIWETKSAMGGTLEEVSHYINTQSPKTAQKLETCRAIIESLKGSRRNDPVLDTPAPPELP